MRIIAGRWKGRRFDAPAGLETRPLLDRIKQSLFDWLGQDCSGWRVADVCAGSGTFGFEAASRGAREVILVESGRHALPVLRKTWQALGSPPTVRIDERPFERALRDLRDLDLVFCDPPFPWYREEPRTLAAMVRLAAATLAPEGLLLVRGEHGTDLPALPPGVRERERRRYGRSWVAVIERDTATA